ncbi:unnamed protein product [Thlaspi arvense]|uniref:Prolamin-like domain-containing protein n=1 Tax=Thlaspi arvense TaxID=13288 RepID=A0AAU9TC06_THLAR|nr:unnamed protein product [Thlaspi arvense]
MIVIIVILSISQYTKGNKDLALAPVSEKGLLPNPVSCVQKTMTIPNCVDAVKHFKLSDITRDCCTVTFGVTHDCFGKLFPMGFVYRVMIKVSCKLLGIGSE